MSDLEKLIAAAEEQQRNQKIKARSRDLTGGEKSTRNLVVVGWIVVGVVMAVILAGLVREFLPISENVVRADLNATLDAAASAVEDYRTASGVLPDRVPAPALANLVKFEVIDGGYRLSVSMNGMTMVRDRPGGITDAAD